MHNLEFPSESHLYEKKEGINRYTGDNYISPFELFWTAVDTCPTDNFSKNDFRVLKALKKKLREISEYKDTGRDSRILNSGDQILVLENSEYHMAKRVMDVSKFLNSRITDSLCDVWDILDKSDQYDAKPNLLR